mgnify:CR=1 FL=1|jgi:predicted DNA-binding ribbon-helix-helix protein
MNKYSVTIAGRHETSFTVEKEFFDELKQIAAARKLSLNELVTKIDSARTHDSLSSSIRIYVLNYIKQRG